MYINLVPVNDYFEKCDSEVKRFFRDVFEAELNDGEVGKVFEEYKKSEQKVIQCFIAICRLYHIKWVKQWRSVYEKEVLSSINMTSCDYGLYLILSPSYPLETINYNKTFYFKLMIKDNEETIDTNIDVVKEISERIAEVVNNPMVVFIILGGYNINLKKEMILLNKDICFSPETADDRKEVLLDLQSGFCLEENISKGYRAFTKPNEYHTFCKSKKYDRDPNVHSKLYKRKRKYF